MTKQFVLENSLLKVVVNGRDLAANVTVKATGETLAMAPAQDDDVMMMVRGQRVWKSFADSPIRATATKHSLKAALPALGLSVTIALDGADVLFTVAPAKGPAAGAWAREVLYPRHFIQPKSGDAYATFPLGQGQLIPGNWPVRFDHREGYAEASMNWLGGYTGKTGYCGIALTPDDLYQAVDHRSGAAASVFFHWLGQHGKLAYPRLARYTFAKGMDYIAQAKLFRSHCKKAGIFRSLKDKIAENPNVARLIGTPVVSFSACRRRERDFFFQANRFTDLAKWVEAYRRQSGFADGMIHLDGWGWWGYDAMHPDILPPSMDCGGASGLAELAQRCKAAGYLFGLHDQYIDFYYHAPSFDQSMSIVTEDGLPVRINRWDGGACGHLCYSHIPGFVQRNYYDGIRKVYPHNHNSPSIWQLCRPTASYMDCFCRTVECWSPDHPVNRTQSRQLQQKLLGIVRGGAEGEGIVLSCEHIRDFGVGVVDFSYAMSTMATDVVTTTGETTTAPIGLQAPLWELVFHDAVSLFCHSKPIEGMLFGQSPLVHLDGKPLAAQAIAQQKTLAAFHKQVALEELTGHKLLSADGSKQSCTYANGLTIEADMKKSTYRITGGKSKGKGTTKL